MISAGFVFIIFIIQFSISKSSAVTYSQVESGRCTDVDNRAYLPDKVSCGAAASSLGLSDTTAAALSSLAYPQGCWVFASRSQHNLYFNPRDGLPCTTSKPCICMGAPACTHTDALVRNDAPCACGNIGCTESSGLYCDVSNNLCLGPPCDITDGSTANPAKCRCGNIGCTTDTGLICYSDVGSGSCRKTGTGQFGYPIVVSGYCTDVDNRAYLPGRVSCKAASDSMGWGDTAYETNNDYYPRGCYRRYSSMNFNTDASSTRACDWQSDGCICMSAPACTKTNALVPNGAPCICGNMGCTESSGLYCLLAENKCQRNPSCDISDGSAANSEACTCGNSDCTESSGLYCDVSNNFCSGPPCDISDGSAANSELCKCGNVGCTADTGLICYSDVGSGSCRKTGTGQFGYPQVFTGTCADAEAAIITDKSTCDTAATYFELSYTDSGSSNGEWTPAGCFWAPSSWSKEALRLNTFVTSGESCNYNYNGFCLCMSAPDCEHKNGLNANSDKCKCGLVACGYENIGFYCTASENKCHKTPVCAHTDGSVTNTNKCSCGNTECTNDTGLFCYSPHNVCADYANPRILYTLVTSGTCAGNGYDSISDSITCGVAYYKLYGFTRTVSDMSNNAYPPGCTGSLYLNTHGTTCGAGGFPCLCVLTAPACAHGDGATANAATCICGDSGACMGSGARSTGMVCDAETSTCSRPTNCLKTDGLVKNAASCACGSVDCASEEYCIAHSNGCSQHTPCSVTDGSDVASVDCACGSVDCKTGEYCHYGTEDWLTQWGLCRESSNGQLC